MYARALTRERPLAIVAVPSHLCVNYIYYTFILDHSHILYNFTYTCTHIENFYKAVASSCRTRLLRMALMYTHLCPIVGAAKMCALSLQLQQQPHKHAEKASAARALANTRAARN